MPSWKKIIVSGSDASLSSLSVDGTVTANSFSGDGSNLTNVGMNASTFNQNLSEAFEIDGDDYVLADTTAKYIVDRRWEVDSNGDVMPRNVMLFTSGSTVSYLED
jgi:hypothetical protein